MYSQSQHYAEQKQAWHEHVELALKDEREEINKTYMKALPVGARTSERWADELRAIDARREENRRALQEHRVLMKLVRAYDVRCGQRAGYP